MSSPEVDWVLAQFADVVDAISAPLDRVDRDDSDILEGNIRSRTGELKDANYVGAGTASVARTPIGTEFDNRVERVIGVRIEGLHVDQWGHVDPGGVEGIPFDDGSGSSLVDRLQTALNTEREFPGVGRSGTTYTTLYVENDAPQSTQYRDYYRYDFDARFVGYETLP